MENRCAIWRASSSCSRDSVACLDYWDCAVDCAGDPFCRDDCDFFYPDGKFEYEALESCLFGSCFDECA